MHILLSFITVLSVIATTVQAVTTRDDVVSSCKSADVHLIKTQFQHATLFCQYYATTPRSKSPVAGLTAIAATTACKCLLSASGLQPLAIPHTKAPIPKECSSQYLKVLEAELKYPRRFCEFFTTVTRSVAFVPDLSVTEVQQACACLSATATKSLRTSSTASLTKKPGSTSGLTTTKPPTTKSATKSSLTSSYLPLATSLANGVEYIGTIVTLATQPTVTLKPYVPAVFHNPDPALLLPVNTSGLYYQGANHQSKSTSILARVNLELQYSSVNLDLSLLVSNVVCNGPKTSMQVIFNSTSSIFDEAVAAWKSKQKLIMITSSSSCETTGQTALFLARSFSINEIKCTVTAVGNIVKVADVYTSMDMDFGTVTPNTTTSVAVTTVNCGTQPSQTLFPTAACGPDFDLSLDAALGFYSGKESDTATVLKELAPGIKSLPLQKRLCLSLSCLKSAVTKAVSTVVKVVAPVVAPIVTPIVHAAAPYVAPLVSTAAASIGKEVSTAASAVSAGISAFQNSFLGNALSAVTSLSPLGVGSALSILKGVASLIAGGSSQPLKIPVNLAPASYMRTDSPWGQQFLIFEYMPRLGKASTGTTPEGGGDGVTSKGKAYAGIGVYCIDCKVTGDLNVVGSVGVKASPPGLSKATIALTGNLTANINLGFYGTASYEKEISVEILTIPISPITIPEIATIGPEIILGASLTLGIQGVGTSLVGANFSWPSLSAELDFVDHSKSAANGFKPTMKYNMEAEGNLTMSAAVGIPISFGVGIDLVNGVAKEEAELTDTPAIELDLTFSGDISDKNGNIAGSINHGDGCLGLDWSLGIVDSVDFEIDRLYSTQLYQTTLATLATGCIGVSKTPVTASSTTTRPATSTNAATTRATTSTSPVRTSSSFTSPARSTSTGSLTATTTASPVSSTSSASASTSPPTCNNKGLQWAEWNYPNWVVDWRDQPEVVKTETPAFTGVTPYVGGFSFSLQQCTGNVTIYNTSMPGLFSGLMHRGYIHAPQTGTFTITVPHPDDNVMVWMGDTAYTTWDKTNFVVQGTLDNPASVTYDFTATAGEYIPIRIFYVQFDYSMSWQGFSISAPDGSTILSSTTDYSDAIVQYSCDGTSAPVFPSWAHESLTNPHPVPSNLSLQSVTNAYDSKPYTASFTQVFSGTSTYASWAGHGHSTTFTSTLAASEAVSSCASWVAQNQYEPEAIYAFNLMYHYTAQFVTSWMCVYAGDDGVGATAYTKTDGYVGCSVGYEEVGFDVDG
ncbi:hypothetical protein K461DRAFT_316432 [Myriangium duriaei CBS 260.36]|uniref:PA14 domain-containing protein n=1 Tax=Myriangium duriaei CBS 260.36 TaxID=1168546 RepID=A0A9P4MCM9_9PEZI|nr:hypothetical protein K461DRAFT_316432 [Myriangium duriaei CBS 260.36]